MRWMIRVAVLVAAVAFGGQLWSRHVEVLGVKHDLDGQRADIAAAESAIDTLDRSIDDSEAGLRELGAKISGIEHEYPDGIPPSLYPEYSRLVAEHNDAVARHNDLVSRQRELHGDYTTRVDRHNARVAVANSWTPCAMLPGWLRRGPCEDPE